MQSFFQIRPIHSTVLLGDSLTPEEYSRRRSLGHCAMKLKQVEKETDNTGATITKQGNQDLDIFYGFIPQRVNPLLFNQATLFTESRQAT